MTDVKRFTKLEEIDFDTLYDASLSKLESGTFSWPETITSPEDKKEFIKARFEESLSLPNGFAFWVGAPNRVAIIGSYWETTFTIAIGLIAPDENGSKAYCMDPAFINTWKTFLQESGYTSCKAFIVNDSPLKATVKDRHSVTDDDFTSSRDNQQIAKLW